VYHLTSNLAPLRRSLPPTEREALMRDYYRPHHARLEQIVTTTLARHGRCLIIDCHSFPSMALPYEHRRKDELRPEICIGTDSFHTHPALAQNFVRTFQAEAFHVALDTPFAGAMVPASRYRKDPNVNAIMVEVNRSLYMDELTGARLPGFPEVARRINQACLNAIG